MPYDEGQKKAQETSTSLGPFGNFFFHLCYYLMLMFLFPSTVDNACGLPNPATLVFTHPPLFHINQFAWLQWSHVARLLFIPF
jgi:hypothetical protein